MPEGDSLYKAAARVRPLLVGQTPSPVKLSGRPAPSLEKPVCSVEPQGKHLLIEFEDGEILRTHLGMHGSWYVYQDGQSWKRNPKSSPLRVSVELWVGAEAAVCFDAKELEFFHRREKRSHDQLSRLGPDILTDVFEAADVARRARELRSARALMVDVLLDQRVTAGIGNVYKNEVLFLEGLLPWRTLSDVNDEQLEALFQHARALMLENLEPGWRVTTATGRSARGKAPVDRPRLWVYSRSGKPCLVCGEGIRYMRLGDRPRDTYWCPGCQS